jgi:hypothetical protein
MNVTYDTDCVFMGSDVGHISLVGIQDVLQLEKSVKKIFIPDSKTSTVQTF